MKGKGFIKADELGIGTSIVTRAGPSLRVLDVQKKDKPATVYNFEVEDFHTYFVGKSALWVHNDCFTDAVADHALLGHDSEFANISFEGIVGFDSVIPGSRERFSRFLENLRGRATASKQLAESADPSKEREAMAYLDEVTGVVYIEDIGGFLSGGNPGSAYRPGNPRQYFDNLPEYIRPSQ